MKNSLVQTKLEEELERLINKWNYGKGWLKVFWAPDKKVPCNIVGVDSTDTGAEVKNARYILVYFKTLKRAIHAVRHEFFEAMLHNNLIQPYDTLLKGVMEAYRSVTYTRKEPLIEMLVKLEEDEYGKT